MEMSYEIKRQRGENFLHGFVMGCDHYGREETSDLTDLMERKGIGHLTVGGGVTHPTLFLVFLVVFHNTDPVRYKGI